MYPRGILKVNLKIKRKQDGNLIFGFRHFLYFVDSQFFPFCILLGHFYLFRGSTRYEFDSKTQRFIGMEKSNSWFDCN